MEILLTPLAEGDPGSGNQQCNTYAFGTGSILDTLAKCRSQMHPVTLVHVQCWSVSAATQRLYSLMENYHQ